MQVSRFEDRPTQIFNQYRGLLFSIAYRMLSSVTDAEDVVQEAWIRWKEGRRETDVRSPGAYLAHHRDSAVHRPHAFGAGPARNLPGALAAGTDPQTGGIRRTRQTAKLAESLSVAFLVMLERLRPVERAVFLLREVFEYEYDEIAAIVGKSEANCRADAAPGAGAPGPAPSTLRRFARAAGAITRQFLRASPAAICRACSASSPRISFSPATAVARR